LNRRALIWASITLFALLFLGTRVLTARALAEGLALSGNTQFLPIIALTDCDPGPLIPPDDSNKDKVVEDGINKIRGENDLSIFAKALELTQAALRHSNDMADNDFFSHMGSDGTNAGQRIEEACYQWQIYGEIIAAGYDGDAGNVIGAWMNSPPHRNVILSDNFNDFGAGYAYNSDSKYRHYWTVDFGSRIANLSSTPEEYYFCRYFVKDESGESLLSLYSIWSCDKTLQMYTDSSEHR